jgi:hypothetical protein
VVPGTCSLLDWGPQPAGNQVYRADKTASTSGMGLPHTQQIEVGNKDKNDTWDGGADPLKFSPITHSQSKGTSERRPPEEGATEIASLPHAGLGNFS